MKTILRYQCPECKGMIKAKEGERLLICGICLTEVDARFITPKFVHELKEVKTDGQPRAKLLAR